MERVPRAKRKWQLDQEAFDRLLEWLNPDRDAAGLRYEEIRLSLIRIFEYRGCATPEEMADDTMNRVTKRLPEISESYVGDPAKYFYGVANNVHLEYVNNKREPFAPPPVAESLEEDPAYDCLDSCLAKLDAESRDLVLRYYEKEKNEKIAERKRIAEELGIGLNTLRIRAFRIRTGLHQCILKCISRSKK